MGQTDDMCITVAWDQAPHWGKKEKKHQRGRKKKLASEPSREVVWEGKRVAAFSPSPGHRWARFARRYFSPFFAFFPHCGAWSQASITVANSELKQREL